MSVYNDIQNALNIKLATVSGLPTVYYPNHQDTPVQGTSYVRPTLLPTRGEIYTLNGGNMHTGLYQVDIYTQLKKGTSPLLLIADAIRDTFKRTSLTQGTTVVHIQNISISQAQRVESWWHCYVEVNYLCVA